jgi:putative ABC transport system permease protein
MFKNNFKIALRSLWKNKASSFINVFGLTSGLTACLLIALYVQHESSYDAFQPNGDRIARVIMEYSFDGSPESKRGNFTSTKVAPVFARTFPEVEASIRMTDNDMVVKYDDTQITEPNFLFADSTFFKIFNYDLLQGNVAKALDGPNKIVLTESTAKRYFRNENPVGKILLIGSSETTYEVTGVIRDYPSNSQIKFDFLASFSSLGDNQEESYFNANYTTYLLLKGEQSFTSLQSKITPFMKKEMAGSGATVNFFLEPFNRVHLYSEYDAFVPNTNVKYLYILSAVGVLTLVIVCFTYINLSTARSIERAKEVGVRKSIGAAKSQLFWQFIGESTIICFISTLLSLQVVAITLPYFNQLIGKELPLEDLFSTQFILFSIGIMIITSFLSGSYPAIILSGFQPVKVLKGVFRNSSSGKWIQQSLIVFQFAISVFLIVSTLIIQKQLHFIQHEKLGYDRDHVVVLRMNPKMASNLAVIKQEFVSNKDVLSVSNCGSSPVKIGSGFSMRTASMPENEEISVTATPIDEDYVKTTGLQIIAGEDVTEQDMKDVAGKFEDRTYHFIINESAARLLGWTPEKAIGQKLIMSSRAGTVKAVIKDFHFESLHNTIKPLVLFSEIRSFGQLLVKVSGQNLPETISLLESKWKQLVPYLPFEYRFMDDDYAKLYQSELRLGMVMNVFSGIAITLACLGLFGLSSYVVRQRNKEIGIRKILGASLLQIVGLLSGNFTKLIVAAIVIASPLAYWLMNQWLLDFAYHIEIQWWVFAISGVSAVAIALLTVSVHTVRAALTNPASSLKTE